MRGLPSGLWRGLAVPLALAGAVGCAVPNGELMEFDISFEGLGCAAAGVDEVTLTFETGGMGTHTWTCNTSGSFPAWVAGVPPGTYRIHFEGLDRGFAVYSGRFDVRHVSGSSRPHAIDLRQTTEVIANFTFAGQGFSDGLTCEQAKITRLNIEVGGLRYSDLPCRSLGRDAVSLVGIDPGYYDVIVDAFDAAGRKLYASRFDNLEIRQASNVFDFNLLPLTTGGMEFDWLFEGSRNCAVSGVQSVEYHLVGPNGSVGGGSRVEACVSGGVRFDDLEPGLYTLVSISGFVGGQERYRATNLGLYVPAGRVQAFEVAVPRR